MPTPRGWGVLVAAVALTGGGWYLGYADIAAVGLACAVALAAGRAWLLRGPRLRVTREVAPTRVPRGDPALGVVAVVALGRWGSRPVLALDRCGAVDVNVEIPRLSPGARHTATYFLPTSRRGEIAVGPFRIAASDPLGLFRVGREYGLPATLLVRPRTAPLAALPPGRAATVDGPTSDQARGGTVTFHALREYVFGDDLRHIHWRTTARTNTLMVRQLVDASLPRTTVLLDTRADAYPAEDDFELAVDIAASVTVAAARLGFPVAVLTQDGPYLTAKGGRAEAAALLDRLALIRAEGDGSLADTVETARRSYAGGSLTLVTSAAGEAELTRLASARQRFDRVMLVRVGPALPPLPAALPVTAIDASDLAAFVSAWRREVRR